MKNFIIEAAVDRPHATLSVMALLLLAGIGARIAIPIESEPNIDVPFFMVSVTHEGISPEDAERLLLKPLESELRIIGGVDEVRALAHEADVREAVDRGYAAFGTANDA